MKPTIGWRKRRSRLSIEAQQAISGYVFLVPWLVGLGLFVLFPLGFSLYMSFQKVRFTGEGMKFEFKGWENYSYAFLSDNTFVAALINILKNTLLVIPIIVLFSLFVAILLNMKFRGRMGFRAVFFLPVIFSTGQVLSEIFNQKAGSLDMLNKYDIAGFVSANVPTFWAEPILTVLNLFVVILWYSGVQILIYLAGLQTIGTSVYEASLIDGATPWEMFWKITLPALTPFILLNVVYTIVDMFTVPLLNPVLNMIVSNMTVANLGYGYASAQGWIYFSVVFVLILIVLGLSRKFVHYAGER
ncbi:carbohydrate ABC transporter permease [Paenibacillus flagellatus]|uniref:Sugar ABC transporter permease n=1 Tax=Paenibacillus flagellatus TaxID=2211139 RepID=A0A2V5KKU3_9BACL|nr:sugar ABC transporter permease [Paenibacillus flagellatus]PYI55440.1 sugar ABC transporter permease [Paenibacillus flagellatus]